jgi:hypothetical protein
MEKELIAAIILVVVGTLFFFNNKAMGEGLSDFYRKLYTKKNTPFMFKAAGILFIVGGLALLIFKL